LCWGWRRLPEGLDYTAVPPSVDTDEKDNNENGDDDSAKEITGNASDVFDMNAIQSLAKKIIDILLRSASNPIRNMKIRAKRNDLKQLKCCQGPSAHTIDLAVKICIRGGMERGIGNAKEILNWYAKTVYMGTM